MFHQNNRNGKLEIQWEKYPTGFIDGSFDGNEILTIEDYEVTVYQKSFRYFLHEKGLMEYSNPSNKIKFLPFPWEGCDPDEIEKYCNPFTGFNYTLWMSIEKYQELIQKVYKEFLLQQAMKKDGFEMEKIFP